jgi:hypothetical protein
MLSGYEGHTVCREGSEGRDSSRPWSPKNGGKGVDSELSMETVLAGFVSLYPPYNWIPAPRFHEDKLCGKDRRRTEEGQGLTPQGVQMGEARLPRVWS